VPVLFPVAMKLGIDPIHLGIIMTVTWRSHDHPAVGAESVCGQRHRNMG